ncbi:MAG TPA: PLP-dependent aminotransferase family protein [Dehalococcoidia bacterium]|nr:PLP-dependent aminotransferase family protein [Dehalococcoidia bacterium]
MTMYESFLSRAAGAMQESAIRRMGTVLASKTDVISFAPGYPAPETFAWAEFAEIAAELLSGRDGSVLQYGPTRGYRPLLEQIAGILHARGIDATPEQLLVTTGSQQGLDLVARVLLDPGDVVLVELPTYTGAITAFRNVNARMVGVPQEADGVDLVALDETYVRLRTEGQRVKTLYVVPNFQNPTGLLIGLDKRRRLLEWAEQRDVLIVEDDPYRDIYFDDSVSERDVRPIKADDRPGRVVYLSSFSKTIAPGFRVAWMAAPAPLALKFEMAKQAEDLLTGSLDQRVVFEACRRGLLERQLPMLRAHYRHKRDVMEASLRAELGDLVSWPAPKGGFFLWTTLPPQIDADVMSARAVEHGVIYVAGQAFFVDALRQARGAPSEADARESREGRRNTVRLSFSAPTPDRIREGVARLAATVRDELDAVTGPAGATRPAAR